LKIMTFHSLLLATPLLEGAPEEALKGGTSKNTKLALCAVRDSGSYALCKFTVKDSGISTHRRE